MATWKGVFGFPVTTFDESGERLDLGLYRDNVEYQVAAGVHNLVPLGSTGEFAYLSPEERRQVVRTTVEQVAGRAPVIPGVSAIRTSDAVRYAQEAEQLGADGVLVIMQTYFPLSDDEVLAHVGAIGEATRLPVFIYNNPGTSKVDFKVPLALRLRDVATVAAVKESSGDLNRVNLLYEALREGPPQVLAGWDTIALPSFALGVKGWCSGLTNVAPYECVQLYEAAVERHDWEEALGVQRRIFPLAEYLLTHTLAAAAKAAMELTGRRAGPPRRPLQRLAPAELKVLEGLIERAGVRVAART